MKNEAILAVLDHLCNEARNSLHAALGITEVLTGRIGDRAQRTSLAIGRRSADQLLRSIDDARELLSTAPPPAGIDELDLVAFAGEIMDGLNLASGKRRRHIVFEETPAPLSIVQDRKGVEQVLTRVLDTASKLTHGTDIYVKIRGGVKGVRLTLNLRDASLAARLVKWLNSTLDQSTLQGAGDLPFGIAVMVAGKRLRALGGSAEQIRDAAGHASVTIDLPTRAAKSDQLESSLTHRDAVDEALNVMVAEDSDDSFFLTELMLGAERVHRALDGSEALHMMQKQRFDIVLMDIHMPGMDGYSAIRSIREWETQTGNARTPLVILSSDDLETQQRTAAASGCSGFLRKPLNRSDLTDLMERLKQSRRLAA